MYTLTLNDGTKLESLTLKRNCLVSSEAVSPDMFRGKLSPVTIAGTKGPDDDEDLGQLIGTHEHMELVYVKERDGEYYIGLREISNSDWENEKLRAVVDYLAMRNGIEM